MENDNLKLTSSEIGTLWGEYINGTMIEIVNKYMISILEDEEVKNVFEIAIETWEKQKKQLVSFMEKDGFPVPNGFTESDLNKGAKRLFSDTFCLNYLHIMTIHGLLGHTTALSVSVRKDLREFYNSCDNDAKRMYDLTIELLLKKGKFQRDPYFYPKENPEYISTKDFTDGFFGKGRLLSATEIISISLNIKKSIMAKTLSIGFSQVAESEEIRTFFEEIGKKADENIQALASILHKDNLPVPMSWESEVTTSQDSPFSDKLMLYHMGFLGQTAQVYYGTGLAGAMRTDLAVVYEKTILKTLTLTKNWFDIMVENKWLEQPPLAPNRKELAQDK
jgi:spore coat protein CotF